MKKILTLLSLAAFSTTSYAQKLEDKPAPAAQAPAVAKIADKDLAKLKHPLKPILWKVEGKGLKKASYLFGSIHVTDKNILTLHPVAEAAYQQADTLATEVDLGLMNQMASSRLMNRKDNKTLKDVIGDDLYAELEAEFKLINPDMTLAPFKKLKTWAVMIVYGMLEEALKGGTMLDADLWERAGKDKKKRWALETNEGQMGGFDKMTEEEQKILLKDAVFMQKKMRKDKFNAISMMKNLYLRGNPELLFKQLEQFENVEGINKEVGEKFSKIMLNDRNDGMVKAILKQLQAMPDKSHFMVAGTLHYVGEHNVVELLKKEGYTVTRQE